MTTALSAIGLHYRSRPFELVDTVDGDYDRHISRRRITVGSDPATANAKPQLWNLSVDLTASYIATFGKNYLNRLRKRPAPNAQAFAAASRSATTSELDRHAAHDVEIPARTQS